MVTVFCILFHASLYHKLPNMSRAISAETISHHRMRMHGFKEEIKWQSSLHLGPFSIQANEPTPQVHPVGSDFLPRFGSPTIFLKISCDGYFVLPIIVGIISHSLVIAFSGWIFMQQCVTDFSYHSASGESAVEKLMESCQEDERGVIFFLSSGNL